MGSASDLPIVQKAADRLESLGIPYELRVLSAHRTPAETAAYASSARTRDIGVIIAAAGKAAALPGVVAAYTTLPVIGLPISGSQLDGVDALYSIVQMPSGIPVATVAINGAENAALLAAQILSVTDGRIQAALEAYREKTADDVRAADTKIQRENAGLTAV